MSSQQDSARLLSSATGAVLFADICNSTALYKRLGDERALSLIKCLLQKCEDGAAVLGGKLVKTIGDEIMLHFPDISSAVSAAIEMQMMTKHGKYDGEEALQLRIGLNSGELQTQNGDFFGNTVNIAARFVDFAAAGKIITSRAAVAELVARGLFDFRDIGEQKFKGVNEPVDCCEVTWETASLTMIRSPEAQAVPCRLQLEADSGVRVLESGGRVSLGRGHDNDVRIESQAASRRHAVIEGRSTSFSITDMSTNGTYILKEGVAPIKIHHETYILTGEGLLGLGLTDVKESVSIVRYRVFS